MAYYRQTISFGPPLTRMVKYLVLVTSAAFLATNIPEILFGWTFPTTWLALRPLDVTHYFLLWEPVTYLFLHASLWHIFFNMLALWMFGSDLEKAWGGRRFLQYYLLTGVGAGLFSVLLQPSSRVPTVGCSGAIFGVLLAYGVLFTNSQILLMFLVPIAAKWFVVIFGVIEFYLSLAEPGSSVSHVAHLGGMLVGYLYLRGRHLPFGFQSRYQEWRRARLKKKCDVYTRRREKKDDAGPWIN